MAGIYIHIPFCKSKCGYCDFFSVAPDGAHERVMQGIVRELEAQQGFIEEPIETIYIGGGTPSLCMPHRLQSLIDTVKRLWDCSRVGEVTVEANPNDLSPQYLRQLARTDVNRLSIGVQSFCDRDLQLMGRRHRAAAGAEAVREAQKAVFSNISIDMIYAVPSMSSAQWRRNIEQALSLEVQHISAYHLTLEHETPFGRLAASGKLIPVDDAVSEEQYLILHRTLCTAGFEHYEISNFARPGYRAQHNSSYWHGKPYLGVGPSAHSFNGVMRRSSAPSLTPYLDAIPITYATETLTAADHYNELIMTSLRCAEGLNGALLRQRFGESALQEFMAAARPHILRGTLAVEGTRYYIPPEKFLLSDTVISDLFRSV